MNEQEEMDLEEEEDPKEYADALSKLKERAASSKIKIEEDSDSVSVGIPCGRELRWVPLLGVDEIKSFIAIEFEKYVIIDPYNAICSYQDETIEASIRILTNALLPFSMWRRLFNLNITERNLDNIQPILLSKSVAGTTYQIEIGKASNELLALTRSRNPRAGYSIKISGYKLNNHDRAKTILQTLSDSIFFQVDISRSIPLALTRDTRSNMRINSPSKREPIELAYPEQEYNSAPLSLYFYGRSAHGLPLLQFLAYYQTIEYYFPIYSQADARKKIKTILKDPSFRLENDDHVVRILEALRSKNRGGFGDEKSQLRFTLNECLDNDELKGYLTESDDRKTFFESKSGWLSKHKISLKTPDSDIRNEVADRIYEIRCKIVHTKTSGDDGSIDLLLPNSKESDLLYYDIDLTMFVAKKVLIASGNRISL